MVNALFVPTSPTSRARVTAIVVVCALLVGIVVQVTATAGAGALTIKRYASPRDAGAVDTNRDGSADLVQYGAVKAALSVGEQPNDGADLRVFFPFWVSNDMVAAAKDGGTATASLQIRRVNALTNRKLVLEAYPDVTVAQKADYATPATRLATLTPVVGKLSVDVTSLVRKMNGGETLALRLRLDGAAPRDGRIAKVKVGMSETTTESKRPVLTVVSANPTEPAETPPATTPPTTTPPATTPPTTTPVPPAEIPDPTPGTGRASASAGTTVGSAQYPVPAGAVVVSPSGNDSAAGTAAAPLRTITAASAKAPSGATIVLRAGTYHEESVILQSNKRLTLQNWPGEAAWLDGSVPVANWVASGNRWRSDGWTKEFDASPTYTRGAADYTAAYWGFVNASYPMAAHPDQIWIDGVAQRQVGSLAEVGAGTFFHDKAANQLWLGSSPAGNEVRASALIRALRIRGEGDIVRGIGIRRFAPSVPDMGAVIVEGKNVLLENVAITDMATTGMHIGASTTPGATLRNVQLARNGLLGMSANTADDLTLDHVLAEGNNAERFNSSPVSGGVKIARSRGIVVRDSNFRANNGPGLWMDVSDYDMTIVNNEMRDNTGHGASLEISAKAVFANNIVTNNGTWGLKVSNTSNVDVWNNTFAGNGASIWIVQDPRRPATDNTGGRDMRHYPDPNMTWVVGPVNVFNNVFADQRGKPNSRQCLLCVEDVSTSGQLTAEQMRVTADANVYHRVNTSSPTWVAWWSKGAVTVLRATTFAAFQSATGQEATGFSTTTPVVDSAGNATAAMPAADSARPVASPIAGLLGIPSGTRHHGAFTG